MKPKKIDLNDYERVDNVDELDGYTSLIIYPFMLSDGTQPPALLLRKGRKQPERINDTNTKWNYQVCIDTKGSYDEYVELVDWWFENALNDEHYKNMINESFNKNNFNIKEQFYGGGKYVPKGIISWLKDPVLSKAERKTHIHKFVWNWLNANYSKHLRFNKSR